MIYAVLNGGEVIGTREIADWSSYPEHKKAARDERGDGHAVLRPLIGSATPPDYDALTTSASMTYQIAENEVTISWSLTPRDLETVKAECKAIIDRDAETSRLKYITAGSGQALEYQEVADEAARYQEAGGLGSYPMLQASVDAGEAANLAAAAALVLQREAAWATAGSTIRRLRIAAKLAISAATTIDQVRAATQVTWP